MGNDLGDFGKALERSRDDLNDGMRAAEKMVKTHVQHGVEFVGALASGNAKAATQSLGGLLMSSPNCIGCMHAAKTILPTLSEDQINRVAGRGFLVFVGTGDPVLTAISVANGIVHEQRIAKERKSVSLPGLGTTTTERKQKTYKGKADCLAIQNGMVYAGLLDDTRFTDETGKEYTYPRLGQKEDVDKIVLTSEYYEGWNDPTSGLTAVTSATLIYEDTVTPTNVDGLLLKHIILGKLVQD